jgi:MFS family permease
MSFTSFVHTEHRKLTGTAAVSAVAAMIGAAFAGSTLVTPLYAIYQEQFGFSQITLTLVYAAYVIGNLAALLYCGRVSDEVGRRNATLPAMAVAIASAIVFLFAKNVGWLYLARILSGFSIGIVTGAGTAWLAELIGHHDKTRATTIATSVNFIGLATSALIAGILAQYTPWPLQLPFVVYLMVLLCVTVLIWLTQETVSRQRSIKNFSMRPAVSVPSAIRAKFVSPAVTGFGAMALVGFYAAIGPTVLAQDLHVTNHAVSGALFFELATIVAATIITTEILSSRFAMLIGLGLMILSVTLVTLAQVYGSMWTLIIATGCCGVAAGLGYRGSLHVVNQIAPSEKRAAVVSSYFICGFSGNALPVIGIGVISTLAGSRVADIVFAGLIVVFALAALGFHLIYAKSKSR